MQVSCPAVLRCLVPVKAHPKTVKPPSGPLPVLPDAHSGLSVALSSATAVSGSLLVCLLLLALGTLLPASADGGSLAAIRRLILDSCFQAFGLGPLVSLPMPHWLSRVVPSTRQPCGTSAFSTAFPASTSSNRREDETWVI